MKKLSTYILLAYIPLSFGALKFDLTEIRRNIPPETEVLDFSIEFQATNNCEIVSIKPDCSCIQNLESDKKAYKTGESGKITAQFNTIGMGGNQTKKIFIGTNSDHEPQTITLHFNVEEYVQIHPKLAFMMNKEHRNAEFTIKTFYDASPHDFKVTSTDESLDIKLSKAESPKKLILSVRENISLTPRRVKISITYTPPNGTKTRTYYAYVLIM